MSTEKNVKFIQGTEVINSYLKTVRRYDVLSAAEGNTGGYLSEKL